MPLVDAWSKKYKIMYMLNACTTNVCDKRGIINKPNLVIS